MYPASTSVVHCTLSCVGKYIALRSLFEPESNSRDLSTFTHDFLFQVNTVAAARRYVPLVCSSLRRCTLTVTEQLSRGPPPLKTHASSPCHCCIGADQGCLPKLISWRPLHGGKTNTWWKHGTRRDLHHKKLCPLVPV